MHRSVRAGAGRLACIKSFLCEIRKERHFDWIRAKVSAQEYVNDAV